MSFQCNSCKSKSCLVETNLTFIPAGLPKRGSPLAHLTHLLLPHPKKSSTVFQGQWNMSPSWCEELLVVTLIFSECIPTDLGTGPGVALAAIARAAAGSAGSEPVWLSMQYTPHLSISLIFVRHQLYCAWLVRCIKGLSMALWQFSHKKTTAQSAWDNFFHDAAFNRLSSGQPLTCWSLQSQWLASAILYWPQYSHGPSKTETTDNALMFVMPAGPKWSAARWELFGFHSSSGVVCFAVLVVVWWGNHFECYRKHKGSTLLMSCCVRVSIVRCWFPLRCWAITFEYIHSICGLILWGAGRLLESVSNDFSSPRELSGSDSFFLNEMLLS